MATAVWTVTARKFHACMQYPRCYRRIKPGEDYARHVVFPGDDANNSGRPLVLVLCQECQLDYGRGMPPRRRRRKR